MIPASLTMNCTPCLAGSVLPLVFSSTIGPHAAAGITCHIAPGLPASLPVGTLILSPDKDPLFRVAGRSFLPGLTLPAPLLLALTDISLQTLECPLFSQGFAAACITLSDKGFAARREDTSGPAVLDMLFASLPIRHAQRFLLPDDPEPLRALVLELAFGQGYDLIVTTGGTGLSPRDQAPEALLPVLTRRLPGFEQAMMASSLAHTPHAALSRALAGTVGACLVLALPGSEKAARENLEVVLPAIPHALEKLWGDPVECGGGHHH